MNSNIKCPKCSEVIKDEKFDFRIDSDAQWYKFTKSNMHCPHCGTRLKYTLKTQFFIYLIGAVFLTAAILVIIDLMPIYSIIIAPLIFSVMFWKYRKICVY